MHFAYPPRKSSSPPPPFRPRSTRSPLLRRTRLRAVVLVVLGFFFLLYILTRPTTQSPYQERARSGKPPVVIVTVLDPTSDSDYLKKITENREHYAARHGYQSFVVSTNDYNTKGSPKSWSKLLAVRHAITKWPDCNWIWLLDQDALIMNAAKSLDAQVLNPRWLEALMIKDNPVVPPDSIIKTFSHLRGEDVNLVLSHDAEGIVSSSILIRNGDWAKFFIETWLDPLYRSYNFQKAERHALEHMVQWHPTVLSKLALVPQSVLAPYTRSKLGATYHEGDLAVMFAGCSDVSSTMCAKELDEYWDKWLLEEHKA